MLFLRSSSEYLGMDVMAKQLLYSVNRTLILSSSAYYSLMSSRNVPKLFLWYALNIHISEIPTLVMLSA